MPPPPAPEVPLRPVSASGADARDGPRMSVLAAGAGLPRIPTSSGASGGERRASRAWPEPTTSPARSSPRIGSPTGHSSERDVQDEAGGPARLWGATRQGHGEG